MKKIDKKEVLKSSLPGLGQLAIIIVIILLLRPNVPILIAILLSFNLISSIAKAAKQTWKPKPTWGVDLLRSTATLSIVALAIWSTNQLLGGWWALIITTAIIVGLILYQKWGDYIETIKGIEVELYGATREEIRDRRRRE